MRGTGPHDWQIEGVFVPTRRTVRVEGGRLLVNQWHHWPGTLYALPVHGIVGPHHSVAATGVARGIDAFKELAGAKTPRGRTGLLREQERVQETVARAEAVLGAAQAFRTQVVTELWETVALGSPTTLEQRARCRMAASYAVDSARQAMDLVYRAGGTTSSQRSTRSPAAGAISTSSRRPRAPPPTGTPSPVGFCSGSIPAPA